jgi:hypothetical protein
MKLNLASTACVLLIFCYAVFGQGPKTVRRRQPARILSASTEGATPGAQTASAMIANAVLGALDSAEVDRFHECMSQNHIPPDEVHKLFVSVRLPAISQTQSLYFVRSDNDQPCPFIGAHSFRYWLIAEETAANGVAYAVRHRGAADSVSILTSMTQHSYDIESAYCTATGCDITTMRFNGKKYLPSTCMRRFRNSSGQEMFRPIPCR